LYLAWRVVVGSAEKLVSKMLAKNTAALNATTTTTTAQQLHHHQRRRQQSLDNIVFIEAPVFSFVFAQIL
jgi:hypothetical protein